LYIPNKLKNRNMTNNLLKEIVSVSNETGLKLTKEELLIRLLLIDRAKSSFWEFCKLMIPEFYIEEKQYLKDLTKLLEDFRNNDIDIQIINMPPRTGKTLTIKLFCLYILGLSDDENLMVFSYNNILSTQFAKDVRKEVLKESGINENKFSFRDIFNKRISKDTRAADNWSLEGQKRGVSFRSSSPSGSTTGYGGSLIVVDDIIKDAEESYNETRLEELWNWFTGTLTSRNDQKFKMIVMFTRWNKKDLTGKLIDWCEENTDIIKYNLYKIKAMKDNGEWLDGIPDNTRHIWDIQKRLCPEDIFSANYQQEPKDIKGHMYNVFNTYKDLPKEGIVYSYTDPADVGEDYCCSIVGKYYNNAIYLMDILYTKDSMEYTDKTIAKMLTENDVERARVESNNGGRIFSKNIISYMHNEFKNYKTVLKDKNQHGNKNIRIFSNRKNVEIFFYYPENWEKRWPEFADSLKNYKTEGNNTHDDAEDAITGFFEFMRDLGYFKELDALNEDRKKDLD